jgi:hypothetical protein
VKSNDLELGFNLNWGWLQAHKSDGRFWFRLFGVGLRFADRFKHRACFSERNGYYKVLRAGKWSVGYLRRLI